MSSVLTNNSAMVALQTLRDVNSDLAITQSEISTGKSIAAFADNSAVGEISRVMESDVKSFRSISASLSFGQATFVVARQAAEAVTDLLTEMQSKIVVAQEDNVDRAKINDDATAQSDQVASVVGAAQFDDLNLVNGGSGNVDILSSLDRDPNNQLDATRRTRLFYLAEFVAHQTGRVLRNAAKVDILIEMNVSMLRGLKGSS